MWSCPGRNDNGGADNGVVDGSGDGDVNGRNGYNDVDDDGGSDDDDVCGDGEGNCSGVTRRDRNGDDSGEGSGGGGEDAGKGSEDQTTNLT